jgi:hypothetical protein
LNQDSPTEVIGSGFVLGIPGIYGNMVVPEPAPDNADVSSISPDSPAVSPQIDDTPSQPAPKAKAAKADKD